MGDDEATTKTKHVGQSLGIVGEFGYPDVTDTFSRVLFLIIKTQLLKNIFLINSHCKMVS